MTTKPKFDQWFIDEAATLGLTPEQYAASLATAILEEIQRLRAKSVQDLTAKAA